MQSSISVGFYVFLYWTRMTMAASLTAPFVACCLLVCFVEIPHHQAGWWWILWRYLFGCWSQWREGKDKFVVLQNRSVSLLR